MSTVRGGANRVRFIFNHSWIFADGYVGTCEYLMPITYLPTKLLLFTRID